MTEKQFSELSHSLHTALMPILRDEMRVDIRREVDGYRRSVYMRDEWCCAQMTKFAMAVWSACKPKHDDVTFGNVAYQLRGHTVNFCPFCGVSFNAPKIEQTVGAL